jgi:diguanylate cyclase (GGDEF)-like protein
MDLQSWLELLPDPQATLSAQEARDHPGFVPNTEGTNSLGFTRAALWLRFSLKATPDGPREVLLELAYPLLDEVSLDLFYPDGRHRTFESGDTQAFRARPLHFTNPTFLLRLPSEGTLVGLLRLRTTGSLQFPLVLRSPAGQSHYSAVRHLAFGLYYGAFVSLALLAGAIFLYSRDSTFLLYGLYLSSFGLLQFSLNGFSHQFLWSGAGLTASRMPIVLIGTTMIFMMLLTIRFLGFWSHSRPLRLAFRVFLGLAVAVILLGAMGPLVIAIPVASAVGTLLLPLILAAGASSLRRGTRTARYFVIAWGLFLFGVSISGLTTAGALPSGFTTTYAMQIGSVLEVWVLALALLDRVRSLREQKDAAVASANRYLRQLNEDLERRVVERTRALEETNVRLADLARRDSLTGLFNHRTALEQTDALLRRARQQSMPVAVIMLDIDHFKQINDQFGHLTGDRALMAVAASLARHTGPEDLCGRYGGEEFLLALHGLDQTAARGRAEALRDEIARLAFAGIPGPRLSASLGVTVAQPSDLDPAESVIRRADSALYQAKHLGRNRVVVAS